MREEIERGSHRGAVLLPAAQRVDPALVSHSIIYQQSARAIRLPIGLDLEGTSTHVAFQQGKHLLEIVTAHARMHLISRQATLNRRATRGQHEDRLMCWWA